MNTDPLAVGRPSAVGVGDPHPPERVGEVLPRLDVVQEAWRRVIGFDLPTPAPATARSLPTARP